MIRSSSVLVAGAALLMLAACSAGPSANAPVPDPSETPSGFPLAPEPVSPTSTSVAEKQSWLVQGQNSFLSGTQKYCSWDESLTKVNPEWPGFGFSVKGPPPDDWNGTDIWDDSSAAVNLDVVTRKYWAQRFDGDLATGLGKSWWTNGTFTFDRNADGVITGGRGTGTTKIILPSGDVERQDDVMTFTVTPIDEMDWCTF